MTELTVPNVMRELHRLRKHLRELHSEIERSPKILKAHQNKLAKQEQFFKDFTEGIKKLKVSLHEHEVSLKTTNQLLLKYEKQHNEATNDREFQALKSEIAHAEGERKKLEEAILALMTEIDEKTSQLPTQETTLAKVRSDLANYEKDAADRLSRLKFEIQETEKLLKKIEEQIPLTYRDNINRIVKAYGADAFAAVIERNCTHCNNSITLEQWTFLERGEFLYCKNCGRVLYPQHNK